MKILITGSSGFIGSRLQIALNSQGHTTRGYDKYFGEDTRDIAALTETFEGFRPDVVVHAAHLYGTSELFDRPRAAVENNVIGLLNVIQLCIAHESRLIFLSSPGFWSNPYEISMQTCEKFIGTYKVWLGLDATILRIFTVYGPGGTKEDVWNP